MAENEGPGSDTWFSAVEPAHVAGSAEAVRWDEAADLVVVGYGGAGVAAAVEAAGRGLRVLAVDRYHGGGATAMNGGVFYAGGGTEIQRQAGVVDTPDDMFAYLREEVGEAVSAATLRRFCAESPAQLAWMMAHGVKFDARLFAGKTSYPPPAYFLYHSDSSQAGRFASVARPAARGHRAFVAPSRSAVGYGVGLYQPLRDAAERLGVRVVEKAEARQLVLDTAGRVLGVKLLRIPPGSAEAAEHDRLERKGTSLLLKMPPAFPGAGYFIARAERLLARARDIERKHRKPVYVRAYRGVCLSTGGFVFNRDMVAHYAPKYARGMPLGSPGDDGSGIRLGQTAGGALGRMAHVSAWRFINPPAAWARGMIVDGAGARFVDETLYGAAIGDAMCEAHGGRAWLVLDAALRRAAWQEIRHAQMLSFQRYPAALAMLFGSRRAATLGALAQQCGMDAAVLAESARLYNQVAGGVGADVFGKRRGDMAALSAGSFMAVDISIDAKLMPLPTLTLGGLKVDEETGGVLRADGAAVPGLYAAGRTAVGICSDIYVSGLAVADCVFSGRRVGQAL